MTGVSRNRSTSENATISSNFRAISDRFIPRIEPLRKMFSRPVRSGWNPVPTSKSEPTRPRSRAVPSVGSVIRLRTFKSVDFPAPFRPRMPIASPWLISNETSLSAQKSSALARSSPYPRSFRNVEPTALETASRSPLGRAESPSL